MKKKIHLCGGVGGRGKVWLMTPLFENAYPFWQVLVSIYFKPKSHLFFLRKSIFLSAFFFYQKIFLNNTFKNSIRILI